MTEQWVRDRVDGLTAAIVELEKRLKRLESEDQKDADDWLVWTPIKVGDWFFTAIDEHVYRYLGVLSSNEIVILTSDGLETADRSLLDEGTKCGPPPWADSEDEWAIPTWEGLTAATAENLPSADRD